MVHNTTASIHPEGNSETELTSPLVKAIAWACLFAFGAIFIYIGIRQTLYPGFAEPVEGNVLEHIERAATGKPIYPAPSSEFIPLAYMPLYYWVCVPFYWLFGDSMAGPRLVSLLSATGSAALVGWIAWRETKSGISSLFACSLFFSSYRIMDSCLFSAQPDALALFLVLLGFVFFAYGARSRDDFFWMLCFALAFWTKQQSAFVFGFAVLYALFFRQNRLPRWALVTGLALGGPVAYWLGGKLMGQEFVRFTLTIPSRWEHSLLFSAKRTWILLFVFAPFLTLMTMAHLRNAISWGRRRISPLAWMLGGLLCSAAFTMTALDSSNNHYIPVVALSCAAAGAGIQSILTRGISKILFVLLALASLPMLYAKEVFARPDIPDFTRFAGICALGISAAIYVFRLEERRRRFGIAAVLLAGQCAVASFNPLMYVPEKGYEKDLAALQAELAKLDGPVIWANFGNVPSALFEFKPARAPSWVAAGDIERQLGAESEASRDLTPFRERIRNARGTYVLADQALENIPGWGDLAGHAILVKDFGQAYSRLRKVAYPWYGNVRYPQYLYRLGGPSAATKVDSIP